VPSIVTAIDPGCVMPGIEFDHLFACGTFQSLQPSRENANDVFLGWLVMHSVYLSENRSSPHNEKRRGQD